MSQSEREICVINACLRGDFTPFTVLCDAFQCVEILAISFYGKNSEHVTVHEARVTMATQKKFDFEKLPPTQAALLEHANRAFFQARIWLQSLVPMQNVPSPSSFGWKLVTGKNIWEILWTKSELTCKDLTVLVSCGCKAEGGCKGGRCKCVKNALPCTEMCSCKCDVDA